MDLLPLTPEKSARRQPPASKKLKEFFDKQKRARQNDLFKRPFAGSAGKRYSIPVPISFSGRRISFDTRSEGFPLGLLKNVLPGSW